MPAPEEDRKAVAYSRADLLDEANGKKLVYEQQDEEAGTQTVRVWGDTAVVRRR